MLQTPIETNHGFEEKWVTAEEYIAQANSNDERDVEERKLIVGCVLEIREDGTLLELSPLPTNLTAKELEEAQKEGMQIVDDKYFIADEPKQWELRGNDLYTKTGVEGTIFDEAVDPWVKSSQDDGSIIIGDLIRIKFVKEV